MSTVNATKTRAEVSAPLKVGLVQINNSFSGQNYLPYSIALLQTYVQKFAADPGRYLFLLPLYKRLRIADAVEALVGADTLCHVFDGEPRRDAAVRLSEEIALAAIHSAHGMARAVVEHGTEQGHSASVGEKLADRGEELHCPPRSSASQKSKKLNH